MNTPEYNQHRRRMFLMSDKIKVKAGSKFKVTDGKINLEGPSGDLELGVGLNFEGHIKYKNDFLNMVCYLLNRELEILTVHEGADLSDLLPISGI